MSSLQPPAQFLVKDQPGRLICLIDANPPHFKVRWYKNGRNVFLLQDKHRFFQTQDNQSDTLHWDQVRIEFSFRSLIDLISRLKAGYRGRPRFLSLRGGELRRHDGSFIWGVPGDSGGILVFRSEAGFYLRCRPYHWLVLESSLPGNWDPSTENQFRVSIRKGNGYGKKWAGGMG